MLSERSADRGQSELIGAILLVVITLILASFVAVYVFDVGGQQLQERAPQAAFTFENTSTGLVATHDGGAAIDADRIEVVVDDDTSNNPPVATADNQFSGRITVGDSARVATGVREGDVVRIVWINPDTDQGTVLAKYEG